MQTKHNVIFTFTQVFTLAQRDPVCLSPIITNYLPDLRGADETLFSKLDSAVLHEDANNSSFFHLTSDQSPAWPDTLSSSCPGRSLLWVKHGGRRWRSPCCCSVYSNTVTNTKMQFWLTESWVGVFVSHLVTHTWIVGVPAFVWTISEYNMSARSAYPSLPSLNIKAEHML